MHLSVDIPDELVSDARQLTGIESETALVEAALTALVQRTAARKLAKMGGNAPDLKAAPRRRFEPAA